MSTVTATNRKLARVNVGFDYASLDARTRAKVQQRTRDIRDRLLKTAESTRQMGEWLIEVKEALGHGKFGEWLKAEFGWSERSAQRLMKVAESFKSANLAEMEIAPSALYLLASESTPAEVRGDILDRAESGEVITYTVVEQAIEEANAAPVAESAPPQWDGREVLEAVYESVVRLNDRCPPAFRAVLGERLVELGKQIIEDGGL